MLSLYNANYVYSMISELTTWYWITNWGGEGSSLGTTFFSPLCIVLFAYSYFSRIEAPCEFSYLMLVYTSAVFKSFLPPLSLPVPFHSVLNL